MRKTLLVVILVLLIAAGGYFVYGVAMAAGVSAGMDTGYAAGQQAGYAAGLAKGKEEGQASGEQAGYEDGYKDGVIAAVGHGFTLHDPTLAEVKEFLAEDRTDEIPYNEPAYVCTHYARDVINNAVARGIRAAYVEIRHPGMGHAIVAFQTVDKGLMYFEPQFDDEVRPALGKRFYECIVARENVVYTPPTYDDTINDILVIW